MTTLNETIAALKQKLNKQDEVAVKIALFGQPGAGKSSLINKIIGEDVAEVAVRTDTTVEAKCYKHNGLEFWDLPGYGTAKFPKETYFGNFKITTFDLFLCVSSGKLLAADTEFFQKLEEIGKTCIFVSNKSDEIWQDGVDIETLKKSKEEDVIKQVGKKIKLFFTSCRSRAGLDSLQQEIHHNLDPAKAERYARSAKAYSAEFLEQKKEATKKYVAIAAAASAANAINPIPGVDISVDVSILLGLFKSIRDSYGLSEDNLRLVSTTTTYPAIARMANTVLSTYTKTGVLALLKTFAGREVVKTVAKYIPFIGQAVAASIGFAITYNAGNSYLEECSKIAEVLLDGGLKLKKV
jgi:small GTP-binding protein